MVIFFSDREISDYDNPSPGDSCAGFFALSPAKSAPAFVYAQPSGFTEGT